MATALKSTFVLSGVAAATVGCAVTATRASATRIAPRYLAFDQVAPARTEAEEAKVRKHRHAMIQQQIRHELQSELS